MTREMDGDTFREKIEALDADQWRILIGGFVGRSDSEISRSIYTTEQNVRKHFSKMFRHFDISPKRGKKRPLLYALMVRHKSELIEFLSDWEDMVLLIRIAELLRRTDPSDKQKLFNKSDLQLFNFLLEALA